MAQERFDLLRLLQAMNSGAAPREAPSPVQIGEQLVIEARVAKASEVYMVDDATEGLLAIVREAPAWLLAARGTFQLQVGEEQWSVVVSGAKKTYARANDVKRRLYIDTATKPAPGFRRASAGKFVPLAKFQQLVAAVNERLPAWQTEHAAQREAIAKARPQYRAVQLHLAEDAPLRIVSRPKIDVRGKPFLKTKLASAPSWLFGAGAAVQFTCNGVVWCCVNKPRMKMHIVPAKKRIVVNFTNEDGYTRGADAALLTRLCDAFNAQVNELRAAAQLNKEQRAPFKSAKFAVAAADQLSAVLLQKSQLCIRVTAAPQWLLECGQTFYLPFQDEIWEFAFKPDAPKLDADTQRLALCASGAVLKTQVQRATVDALLAAVSSSLPAWRAAWEEQRAAEKQKRLKEYQRYGPIKRQRVQD